MIHKHNSLTLTPNMPCMLLVYIDKFHSKLIYVGLTQARPDYVTRRMQGMFGVSVSELYILIKLLINIERTIDLYKKRNPQYTGTVSQGWLVQHTLQVMEMAWTDNSTLAISITLLWEEVGVQ